MLNPPEDFLKSHFLFYLYGIFSVLNKSRKITMEQIALEQHFMDTVTLTDTLGNKWPILRNEVRKRWTKLTDEDLDRVNGKTDELIRVLRRRYGYAKVQAGMEINKWLYDFDQKNKRVQKEIKASL
jgi:uncharacterized protein YjbJ (UPF0337 family)